MVMVLMFQKIQTIIIASLVLFTVSCNTGSEVTFSNQVADYIQNFPYQETYKYMETYTGGLASELNKWLLDGKLFIAKAGEDVVVRMNNDTYYKMAFMDFSNGPVKLSSNMGSEERFSSFQLMDNRNTNFENIIHPKGDYYLYYGETPKNISDNLIQSPSNLAVVIVRVEVKDKDNEKDLKKAQTIFNGITIEGPQISEFPTLDLLSSFDEMVAKAATRLIDSTFKVVPFNSMVASPDQIPEEVSYLNFAAGTKGGWGGPVTSHSSYEMIFLDNENNTLDGCKGDYTLTTTKPPVDAFWSVTVYDTERGGFFHPNAEDKYHINNTSAIRNGDGMITFIFKTKCEAGDVNCLEDQSGPVDITARYYLPKEEIRTGKWTIPKAVLVKN